MPADHKERAFETAIENHLVMKAGYSHGDNGEYEATGADFLESPLGYDRELALPRRLRCVRQGHSAPNL